jgi:hypothetical protein
MGASGWNHVGPYEPDLNAVLARLRLATFANGDYRWPYGANKRRPTQSTNSGPARGSESRAPIRSLMCSGTSQPRRSRNVGTELVSADTAALYTGMEPSTARPDRSPSRPHITGPVSSPSAAAAGSPTLRPVRRRWLFRRAFRKSVVERSGLGLVGRRRRCRSERRDAGTPRSSRHR